MNWRWYIKPAKPVWLYAVIVGLIVGIGLYLITSYWPDIGGLGKALIAACLGGFGGIFAKMVLERNKP